MREARKRELLAQFQSMGDATKPTSDGEVPDWVSRLGVVKLMFLYEWGKPLLRK